MLDDVLKWNSALLIMRKYRNNFDPHGSEVEKLNIWIFEHRVLFARLGLLILGVSIYGPWLRTGQLLGFDWISGPNWHLPPALYGLGQGRASVAPVAAFMHILNGIIGAGKATSVALLLSPLMLGFGMEKVLGKQPLAWFASALFASVNPFIDERLGSAAFGVTLSFVALPFVIALARDCESGRVAPCIKLAILIAVGTALSPQFLFLALLLTVLIVIIGRLGSRQPTQKQRCFVGWLTGGFLLLTLSAYWLVPVLVLGFPSYSRIGAADLAAFRSQADPHFGLYPNLIGLYGFFRPTSPLPKSILTGWWAFLLAILFLVVVGFRTMWSQRADRHLAISLSLAGLAGLITSAGTQGPFGGLFLILYRHVLGLRAFREPEKALALLAIAYAIFYGAATSSVMQRITTKIGKITFVVMLLALPVFYGITEFWGLAGSVSTVRFPPSWTAAQQITSASPGEILIFPWNQFQGYRFTQGRVVANPAPYFFSDSTIVSGNSQIPQLGDTSTDPREQWILKLISLGNGDTSVGRLLMPLGVKWVLLEKTANWRQYKWLYKQGGLVLVHEWKSLALFKNKYWSGELYSTAPNGSVTTLVGWSMSPTNVPIGKKIAPGSTLTLTLPYNPGWRIGGLVPTRNEAGTNTFGPIHNSIMRSKSVVFISWSYLRIIDATSLLALVISSVYLGVDRLRRA